MAWVWRTRHLACGLGLVAAAVVGSSIAIQWARELAWSRPPVTRTRAEPRAPPLLRVEIQRLAGTGIERTLLDEAELDDFARCWAELRAATPDEADDEPLLQTTFLLLVTDDAGTQMYELLTETHLKGQKSRYFRSYCAWDQIQAAVR